MKGLMLVLTFVFTSVLCTAQHEGHNMNMPQKKQPAPRKKSPQKSPKDSSQQKDTSMMRMDHEMEMPMDTTKRMNGQMQGMPGMKMQQEMTMPGEFSRNLPMQRSGSGTSWQPDNSPMYMLMWMPGKWNLMLHYGIFFNYTDQNVNGNDKRGHASQFIVPNWEMLMANRPMGKKGQLMLRGMFSLDPLTVGGRGYPLLFQTGESWKGEPLVDRQHPHDLFSELSIGYSYAFNQKTDVFAYFGLPGEPALGPPAFMHRPSALNMPDAPISHHWQDATHITFGVATLGLRYKNLQVDGSLFNGREPDENRFDIDPPKFNSYSFRLSVNPDSSLALSVSAAHIQSPEALEPETNIDRITASALHNIHFSKEVILSSAFVWGLNLYDHPGKRESGNSLLLESSLRFKEFSYFLRAESVQKSFEELGLAAKDELENNLINSISLGLSRYLLKTDYAWADLGAQGSLYLIDKKIKPFYGNAPVSFEIFLRITPPMMKAMRHGM